MASYFFAQITYSIIENYYKEEIKMEMFILTMLLMVGIIAQTLRQEQEHDTNQIIIIVEKDEQR